MKRLLNTLYVTTEGAYVNREGETLQVSVEGAVRLRVPVHTLGGLICFGRVMCTPPALALCAETGIAVSFFSEYGRFLARMEGPVSGNVLLRRAQYRAADNPETSAAIARDIVAAKISNARNVLLRAARDHQAGPERDRLSAAATDLSSSLSRLESSLGLDSVRGVEGDAARRYFAVFDDLIVAQKSDFFFQERSRRPPLDNVNALLSFLYTLLLHDCRSALEGVGLDPAVGFLHRDRPGRPGLALDLMEEFRPFLADRLALALVNRKQVQANGFRKTESGAVTMDDDTRKTVIVAYQERKQEELTHSFLDEKIPLGLLPHAQALLLARHLRGDLDGYPPYFWK